MRTTTRPVSFSQNKAVPRRTTWGWAAPMSVQSLKHFLPSDRSRSGSFCCCCCCCCYRCWCLWVGGHTLAEEKQDNLVLYVSRTVSDLSITRPNLAWSDIERARPLFVTRLSKHWTCHVLMWYIIIDLYFEFVNTRLMSFVYHVYLITFKN